MAFDKPSPINQWTQELRLATTMTGGVSLAIWMAGVTREINLLSQASQWRRVGKPFPTDCRLSTESAACLKLYAELIDLLDVVVDVDILSGTSAGGINAAVLGLSRVRGYDLGALRELWLELGALTDLLRDPKDKNTPSLLYGDERMFAALAKQLPDLETGPFPPAALREGACLPPTTLYITTTLLTGETGRFTDSFGTLVQDVDRRGLFTFTETDLAQTGTVEALALAARSSASFPVAFEPSFVPFNIGTPEKGDVPARPAMADFTNITRPHWVADGGLLDNRPIDVLLKRIFDRPAHRPVRRVLLFVVPSSGPAPDLMHEAPADNVDEPLGLVDGLLKELSAITTQSIAADLRAIREHQDRMQARTDARLHLAELAGTQRKGLRLLTASLLTDYATREATRQAQALTSALLRQLSTWPPASGDAAEAIPKNWEDELGVGGGAETVCRQGIIASIEKRWSQPDDQTLPDSPADLARYGQPACDLAKVCGLAVADAAYRVAKSPDDVAAVAKLAAGIHEACEPRTRVDIGELVREVCTDPAARKMSLKDAAGVLAQRYLEKSTVTEKPWDMLGAVFADSYQNLERLAANGPSATRGPLEKYLAYLGPEHNPRTMAMKLFDLATTQRAMLPAEADIEQSLELVQVSADTRSLLAPGWQTAQQKLTGMQFHHFGAFYKRSWRANDWMWGRLDGAGWLVHVLLDPRRVRWIVQDYANERQQGAQGKESGAQWFLRKLKSLGAHEFPSSGYVLSTNNGSDQRLTENDLLDELRFLDDQKEAVPFSIPKTSLWLAQAWQRRILDEELDELANSVIQKPDWSPTNSRTWAKKVLDASAGDAKYALLKEDPVASETFASDKGSPLMTYTIAKAAATASGALGSIRQLPGVLKLPLIAVRTLTLAGYRVVSLRKGV